MTEQKVTGEMTPEPREMDAHVFERAARDFYVEPAWAVEGLLDNEYFAGSIWDPAAGTRTIERVCKARGLSCLSTDIDPRGDDLLAAYGSTHFLAETWLHDANTPVDNIIANPPFGEAVPFVHRALELSRHKVAFLLRLTFLESARRQPLFRETPLARVLVSTRRVNMPPGGSDIEASGGRHAYAWFVWRHGHRGDPTIGWF
jgi:predicted RNA methylase